MKPYTIEQAQKLEYPTLVMCTQINWLAIATSHDEDGFHLIDGTFIYFTHAFALPDSIIRQLNSVQSPPKNTLIIFGAPDYESIHARKVLLSTNCFTATATYQGKPVYAGNAAKADGYVLDNQDDSSRKIDSVIIFECNPNISPIVPVVCDHHAQGDFGYSMGAAQYWAASSIGQMCKYLSITPDQQMLMIAAGDHCPADAYKGLCPNVDPHEFAQFRISLIADFLNIDQMKVFSDINNALILLYDNYSENHDYSDLREFESIEQLPEAALRIGKAYIANAPLPEGITEKIVMGGHTTPEQIERFMREFAEKGYSVYGNPTRGFAGATK